MSLSPRGASDSGHREDPLPTGSPAAYDDGEISNGAGSPASPGHVSQSPTDLSGHAAQGFGTHYVGAFSYISEENIAETASTSDSNAVMHAGGSAFVTGSPLGALSTTVAEHAESVVSTTAVGASSSAAYTARDRVTPRQPSPAQTLVLNKHNLATFEDSVQRGDVPLRTDVIDDRHFFASAAAAANRRRQDGAAHRHLTAHAAADSTANCDASVSTMTNNPAQSHHEGSLMTQTENDLLLMTAGTPVTMGSRSTEAVKDPHQPTSPLNCEESSRVARAERLSVVSVEGQVGSPHRRTADALSQENLQLHMRELTSGVPVPLTSENIVPARLSAVAHRGTPINTRNSLGDEGAGERSNPPGSNGAETGAAHMRDASLVVEGSEAAPSELASLVDMSVLRTTLRDAAHSDPAEEIWSTTSTRDPDGKSQASWAPSTEARQSLSKKNLQQLRRQLESGETPLRPEVLAGLSSVAKVINARSEPSPSMVVEVPRDETRRNVSLRNDGGDGVLRRADGAGGALGGSARGSRNTHHSDDDDGDVGDVDNEVQDDEDVASCSVDYKSPANRAVDNAASDAGGVSFHSTFVEAPNRGRGHLDVSTNLVGGGGGGGLEDRRETSLGARNRSVSDAVGSISNNGASMRESPSKSTRARLRGHVGAGGAAAVVKQDRKGHGAADRLLDVSGDLSATNVDLYDDVDDAVVDEEEDDANMQDEKSTTALSPDDENDGHNDESVFMTEDGMEPHDDVAYLKRCLADVIRTLKDTRQDQVKLSRQLQGIKDELNLSHASGRDADLSDRNWEHTYSNPSSPPPVAAAEGGGDPVSKHITSLRADMDEVRLYMREMQRAQLELLHRIDRMESRHRPTESAGTTTTSAAASHVNPPLGLDWVRQPPPALLSTRRIRVVVQSDTRLLQPSPQSSTQGVLAASTSGSGGDGGEIIRFLMPMKPEATVRQCKEEFLSRLADHNAAALADLTPENTYIEMNGHALFDSLVIGTDLQLDGPKQDGFTFVLKKSR